MKVVKRDGRVVDYDVEKIRSAISRAFVADGRERDQKGVDSATETVHQRIEQYRKEQKARQIHIEEIQDIVEEVLMDCGYPTVARRYILYREKRHRQRGLNQLLGVVDDLKLGVNAATVLKQRYLLRNREGNVIETPSELFRRVARTLAKIDRKYDKEADVPAVEEQFFRAMTKLEFLPNSPTLFNAGTDLGLLSACFVLPIEDSIDSIFDTAGKAAKIMKAGGGVGFSFSRLRPKGDIVGSTGGLASGPVTFMRVFDVITDVIKQGGRRRGAMMATLRVDHPDILEFIKCKEDKKSFRNFNISVAITDEFMRAFEENRNYALVNPRTGAKTGDLSARMVMDQIIYAAWATGDPGLIFIDRINDRHPLKGQRIEATNPCGEVPLLPWESCNLGSVNLSKFVKNGKIEYNMLRNTVQLAIHFLDNVIDANKYPYDEIEIATRNTRKIGLGVMGFAEMLIQLGIPYDSDEAVATAEEVMSFIEKEARIASRELAMVRGSFPAMDLYKRPFKYLRNATMCSIAPTGTIGIIAGTSSGIEPLFGVSYMRVMTEGIELMETNQYFVDWAEKAGIWRTSNLEVEIARTGSVTEVAVVPDNIKRLFKISPEIPARRHLQIQAAFQKHVDNAVSKTVNLPNSATPDDVRSIYLMAWELGCKGITVYRDKSLEEQVIYRGGSRDESGVKCELADPSCPKCHT